MSIVATLSLMNFGIVAETRIERVSFSFRGRQEYQHSILGNRSDSLTGCRTTFLHLARTWQVSPVGANLNRMDRVPVSGIEPKFHPYDGCVSTIGRYWRVSSSPRRDRTDRKGRCFTVVASEPCILSWPCVYTSSQFSKRKNSLIFLTHVLKASSFKSCLAMLHCLHNT